MTKEEDTWPTITTKQGIVNCGQQTGKINSTQFKRYHCGKTRMGKQEEKTQKSYNRYSNYSIGT